jgi:hypothetical protein
MSLDAWQRLWQRFQSQDETRQRGEDRRDTGSAVGKGTWSDGSSEM